MKRAERKRIAGVAALAALIVILGPLPPDARAASSMRFDRIGMADGLSQNGVMAIAQDSTGYLWFATESGLDRYDGIAITNYRRNRGDSGSLGGEFIRDLSLAADGSLWIATDGGGVSRWQAASDRFVSFGEQRDGSGLSSNQIRVVTADPRGFVWIGSRDAGLDRLNPETGEVRNYAHVAGDGSTISSNDIYALEIDDSGMLWIGTRRGLDRLNPSTDEVTHHIDRPEDAGTTRALRVQSLLVDNSGSLWAGTRRNGLYRYDTETQSVTQYRHSDEEALGPASDRIETLFEDDKGRVWIGTDNGLSLWDHASDSFVHYRHDDTDPSSLSGNYVISLFQDRGGMLWVGTRTGGVNKWNPRSWSFGHFNPSSVENAAFSAPNVTAFAESADGTLWVGTFGGGVNVLDTNHRPLRHIDDESPEGALSDSRVMALLSDSNGQVWAGTMRGGLNRIDPDEGSVVAYRHDADDPSSIASDGIMSLMEDSQRRLWVGTFGGGVSVLSLNGPANFTNHVVDSDNEFALASPRATSFAEDRNGIIWVGTDGGGLHWLESGANRWHRLQHDADDPNSISGDTVYALYPGSSGDLWVGTRSGLDRLTGSPSAPAELKFENVLMNKGLVGNAVYGIHEDGVGDLWLSTNNGLIRYSPDTQLVRSFHRIHGLQDDEFNFGASYAATDGRLYFGGLNGFNAFRPGALEFNSRPPEVVLTSLAVANQPVDADQPYDAIQQLSLDYNDDVVTFGIAALDYAAPSANQFAYRLEGFDDDWVQAGNERRITYTNLDGGEYTLRITAANSDGVWNAEGIAIPISVAAPPWRTWWAYTAYASVLFLVPATFWRRQQRKLQQESEYRRRLEHEVHARTKLINSRNKELKRANERLVKASMTDPLTGLRNRRFLYEQIAKDVDLVLRHYRDGDNKEAGGNNDLLFLMVDLDNFKPVNDTCGHQAGDELLLQIRDVLLDACRFSDDVIRWGGDEFLVLARETNREFASNLAERVRASLAQRVFSVGKGKAARITTSIGYASYPFLTQRPDLLSWQEVLGIADAAMYEAKQKRNAWMGIEGVDWDGTGDELYTLIKEDPVSLAENGTIRALESIDESAEGFAS